MNDHNLDDLIIDDIQPTTNKTKTALTIVILLIAVLIVAVILTKIILKDPNAEQIAFEKNNTELISPELTLQNVTEEKEPKEPQEDTNLSTIIENELKTTIPAPVVVKEEISQTLENNQTEETTKELAETITVSEKKVDTPTVETTTQKEVEEPVATKIIEKAKKEPAQRPVNIPVPKPVTAQTHYIQVGSFTQSPSQQFLNVIKNSGFNYKITPATASGTKKLLIGPYESRKAADAALANVKNRINKSAFVVKK